jgi:hypothetical protein
MPTYPKRRTFVGKFENREPRRIFGPKTEVKG